jgi:hypothetical protein
MVDEISEILHQEGRRPVNARVVGYFNSIVGEGSTNKIVEPFGLCERNDKVKMLINFCRQQDLVMMNTWFKNRKNPEEWKR